MSFDFDKTVDRRGTDSLKYDFAVQRGRPADVLPLWVADMDFQSPPAVREAISGLAVHGIFGYSDTGNDYFEIVADWFRRRFGWKPEAEWLIKTPGVVPSLALAIRAFSEPGDAVLIQPPVYYPFYSVIRDNGRIIAESPLVRDKARYVIDFNDFEDVIVKKNVRLFILCSPHNPVGRVWTREELKTMGDICERHGVTVVSDEIHCDIVYPGSRHTIFADACPSLVQNCVICTAPSKTFNTAGLQLSNIFIPSPELRSRFRLEIDRFGYSQPNQAGIAACKAAYAGGAEWLSELLVYLDHNRSYIRNFLENEIPQISVTDSEGTYFAWLDCSGLGLSDSELNRLVTEKANLWLDAGRIFGGESGRGYQRLVYACPRATLENALESLKRAVKDTLK
ncbi:MAG: pyridoxal phosphate-dependent aminotransferase [Clostridiales bacterium]|nr:pyridoxal phosphate-dependent aminotransferase [Clostridiales bacterium]